MFKPFARCVLCLALLSPALALAQAAQIDVPAGNLVAALDALAHQTGMQFVYSADQLDGLRTRGAHGQLAPRQALAELLAGTGYHARNDPSGAVVMCCCWCRR